MINVKHCFPHFFQANAEKEASIYRILPNIYILAIHDFVPAT